MNHGWDVVPPKLAGTLNTLLLRSEHNLRTHINKRWINCTWIEWGEGYKNDVKLASSVTLQFLIWQVQSQGEAMCSIARFFPQPNLSISTAGFHPEKKLFLLNARNYFNFTSAPSSFEIFWGIRFAMRAHYVFLKGGILRQHMCFSPRRGEKPYMLLNYKFIYPK